MLLQPRRQLVDVDAEVPCEAGKAVVVTLSDGADAPAVIGSVELGEDECCHGRKVGGGEVEGEHDAAVYARFQLTARQGVFCPAASSTSSACEALEGATGRWRWQGAPCRRGPRHRHREGHRRGRTDPPPTEAVTVAGTRRSPGARCRRTSAPGSHHPAPRQCTPRAAKAQASSRGSRHDAGVTTDESLPAWVDLLAHSGWAAALGEGCADHYVSEGGLEPPSPFGH